MNLGILVAVVMVIIIIGLALFLKYGDTEGELW